MATAILGLNRLTLTAVPWRALVIALSLAGIGWALHYMGAFVAIDGVLYDRLTQLAPAAPASKNVVLVRSRKDRTVPEAYLWGQALSKLNALGAKQVVFTRLPEGPATAFINKAMEAGNVVVGRAVTSDSENARNMYLEDWPVAAEQLKQGLVFIPHSEKGVHRHHEAQLTIDGSIYQSLEVVAANSHTGTWPDLKDNRYRVNFSKPVADLPSVSLQQVLDDELISELIKDHTVVIGGSRDVLTPGLVTPVAGRSGATPLLRFQGIALNTLTNKAQIDMLNPLLVLLVLTGLTLLNIVVYTKSTLRGGVVFTVSMMVALPIAAGLTLGYLRIWLPLMALLGAQFACMAYLFVRKAITQEHNVSHLLAEATRQLQDKIIPESIYTNPDLWPQLVELAHQVVNTDRMVFLNAKGRNHLEIATVSGCETEDFVARNLKANEAPFNEAKHPNVPVPITTMKQAIDGMQEQKETQYMVRLEYEKELQGYWIFGVQSETEQSLLTLTTVRALAGELSSLIYHWRSWQENEKATGKSALKPGTGGSQALTRNLKGTLDKIGWRVDSLESVLNGLESAAVVYDPFGRVLYVNDTMSALAQQSGLQVFKTPALRFIQNTIGTDEGHCRQLLQHMYMEKSKFEFPIRLQLGVENRTYLFKMQTLQMDSNKRLTPANPMPFEVGGLLFELIDVSQVDKRFALKSQLVSHVSTELRNNCASLLMAINLLTDTKKNPEQQGRLIDVTKKKVTELKDMLDESRQYMQVDTYANQIESYPVDLKPLVNAAISEVETRANRRKIKLQSRSPEFSFYAVCDPLAVMDVMIAILELQVADAVEDSTIRVIVKNHPESVTISLINTGFGVPNERLQEYLFGSDDTVTGEMRKVRECIPRVRSWNGDVQAESAVGTGMKFELNLRRFLKYYGI